MEGFLGLNDDSGNAVKDVEGSLLPNWMSECVHTVWSHPKETVADTLPYAIGALSVAAGLKLGAFAGRQFGVLPELGGTAETMAAGLLRSENPVRSLISHLRLQTVSGPLSKQQIETTLTNFDRQVENFFVLGANSGHRSVVQPISRSLNESSECTVKGFDHFADLDERLEALRRTKVPVNYMSLVPKDSKVVLFGETHPVTESRDELIANMAQFKQMGFTHLAMEALPKKRQPLLDAYFAGSHPNATEQAIEKALKRDWNWDTASYMRLIGEAKAHGIRILPVDKKIPAAVEEAWQKAGKYVESSRVREEQWAHIIFDQVTKQPPSRVLVLAGKAHVGIDQSNERLLTSLLTQKELKPLVINLNVPAHETVRAGVYTESVMKAGLQGERFAVPITNPTHTTFRPADFTVNLPPQPGSNMFRDPFVLKYRTLEERLDNFERPANRLRHTPNNNQVGMIFRDGSANEEAGDILFMLHSHARS